MANPSGYVVWEGHSRLNHDKIAMIVTLNSVNAKTGNMPQVWFLHQRMAPTTATQTGHDEAICGQCAFRPLLAKGNDEYASCYVTLIHGPNQIWKAYRAGRYPALPRGYRFERPVRIGSYGDPAAVPLGVLRSFVLRCDAGWTAYTHQWRRYPGLKGIAMASVNSLTEQVQAQQKGYRTFRVIQDDHPGVDANLLEILCPAGEHDGFAVGERTTCAKCRICDGARPNDRRKHIAVYAH